MLMLFVGMFLVVQSVYEDRIRVLEAAQRVQEHVPVMYEPAETIRQPDQEIMGSDAGAFNSVFKSQFDVPLPL